MMLPWYIYYPVQFINWCIEHPRLSKALICITVVILGLLVYWVPAHAATPIQINAAITKVKENAAEVTSILIDPKDGTLYKVGVRDLPFPACGQRVAIGVSTISILPMNSGGQTADLTSIDVITSYEITSRKLMILDLNADGKVDSVAPMGAITNEVAQPIFDKIIACVVATTK